MIRDEIQHVALGMSVDYEGIFSLADLMVIIDSFFRKKGYTKHVMSHSEEVEKSGRSIKLRLRPYLKIKSNKLEVQLWLNITNLVDIKKIVDGVEINLNKGKVNASIDAFVIQDVRGKWEARDMYVFIRTIFDKFLFTSKGKDYEGMVKGHATELRDEINSFLNLNKFLF